MQSDPTAAPHDPDRRGRPPATSRRALELIALHLFGIQGYEYTTVDQIAAEAGVSRRTYFRYFTTKSDVLWGDFDTEVARIRQELAQVPPECSIMEAISQAVVKANLHRPEDVPELRARMRIISSEPDLYASSAMHYDAWERAISEFVARRLGQPPNSLYPCAVGHATLATCRAAYEHWVLHADVDLTVYLAAALSALAAGFKDDAMALKLNGQGHNSSHEVFSSSGHPPRRAPGQKRSRRLH